jgi:hypothetical protein
MDLYALIFRFRMLVSLKCGNSCYHSTCIHLFEAVGSYASQRITRHSLYPNVGSLQSNVMILEYRVSKMKRPDFGDFFFIKAETRGSLVVKTLGLKQECRGFETR